MRRFWISFSFALAAIGTSGALADNLEFPEGMWQSQGYTQYWVIERGRFAIYDVTSISCLRRAAGSLEDLRHLTPNEPYPVLKGVEKIGEDRIRLHYDAGATTYDFVRVSRLPERCEGGGDPSTTDPERNFEVFWHAMKENFAFFALREVDWDSLYRKYRPHVSEDTTELELFYIIKEMIKVTGDNHVDLTANEWHASGGRRSILGDRLSGEFGSNYYLRGARKIASLLKEALVDQSVTAAAHDLLVWAQLDHGLGYLGILTMFGYAGKDWGAPEPENLRILEVELDRAMADLQDSRALIIDVRCNPGGNDAASLLIARRFADQERVALTKKAVHGEGFANEQAYHLYPDGPYQYTKPVFLLTSHATASAAEVFVVAMSAYPHVTRIGMPTQGILADPIPKYLPNGWQIYVSNEVYVASDGKLYERTGVPPQIRLPVFSSEDTLGSLLDSLHKAIEVVQANLEQ